MRESLSAAKRDDTGWCLGGWVRNPSPINFQLHGRFSRGPEGRLDHSDGLEFGRCRCLSSHLCQAASASEPVIRDVGLSDCPVNQYRRPASRRARSRLAERSIFSRKVGKSSPYLDRNSFAKACSRRQSGSKSGSLKASST